MNLRDYLEKTQIKRKHFAGMIGITIQHFNAILNGLVKPGDKTVEKIEKLTKKEVKEEDLLREYHIKSGNKKSDSTPDTYCCAPEKEFIPTHIQHDILPNVSHDDLIDVHLSINGQTLFRKVIHCDIKYDEYCKNDAKDSIKVNCRTGYRQMDIIKDILNQGIPPVGADITIAT